MNAALGGVSAGGLGTPLLEVVQNGGGPSAFVASHPAGNPGGITVSKLSLKVAGREQSGQVPALLICAVPGMTATQAAMSNSKTSFRVRVR